MWWHIAQEPSDLASAMSLRWACSHKLNQFHRIRPGLPGIQQQNA
jgi:hypothetical protein